MPRMLLQFLDFYSIEESRGIYIVPYPATYQMLTLLKSISVSSLLLISTTFGAYKDDVRYTELANELNLRGVTSIPTGAGVGVTQVEAGFNVVESYVPSSASEFSGKTITDQTGGGTTSSHATWVGQNLYGTVTSIAPGIDTVHVYSANDWINNRGWLNGEPDVETNPLQNHSWISETTSANSSLRMDYAVERDGFLPCVGLNNENTTTVPATYGSIYNGITVGRNDGGHSAGGTVYDTAGRTKPEIVAQGRVPGQAVTSPEYCSFSTPIVTAAAAFLIDAAGSDSAAKDQITLKAILLAGADKGVSATWDQTTTRPIDEVYGAGELDIYESYFIQQAGQQAVGSSIDERGWNLTTLARRGNDDYSITVPSGFRLRNLSALVTWNRTVSSNFFTSSLANLSLTLTDDSDDSTVQFSNSSVDNIEHIWRDSSNALPTGDYTLTVAHSTNSSVPYALAWRSELYQDYTLWSSSEFTSTPALLRDADDDPDADGIKNLLEQAFGGDPEAQDLDILPISETIEDNGQSYLQISYRKPEFENGLTYTVETVTDLNGIWSSQSSEVELISIASELGGFDRYTYRLVDPISATSKAFLRVQISETP